MVFFSERPELCCGDRGAVDDEDSEDRNETGRRIAAEESGAGLPLCYGRFTDTVDPAVTERSRSLWTAVLGVYADLRPGHPKRKCPYAGIADEFGGSGGGAGRAALCGAYKLQGTGAVDWGDFDHVRHRLADFFRCESLLAVRRSAVRCGVRDYFADGCDQHADAKPRTGRAAQPGNGGIRHDVHGRAADWRAARRRRSETYRRAARFVGIWILGAIGKSGFCFGPQRASVRGGGSKRAGTLEWPCRRLRWNPPRSRTRKGRRSRPRQVGLME